MKESIGKVKVNLDFYDGVDRYSDGDIEDELLEIVRNHPQCDYDRIAEERMSWPVLYHLSPMRGNCIEWIEMRKDADTVLEIGAGCGAVTGELARRAKHVTCVELSKRRSIINATRNQELDNIEIYVGNFERVETALPQFDVVALIGVLEYAYSYANAQRPNLDFLRAAGRHLKPGGRLVLAIENKFGMKYWAGCREDHTDRYFDSVEGYPGNHRVRTYGRTELDQLLQEAGFHRRVFYYPYPDYKLPTAIYSDSYLPAKGSLSDNGRNFAGERLVLFDERKAFDSVLDGGLFPEFANSFLVIAQKTEEEL